jgi:uncharacterized protein YbjT (DUF2867 family)
MSDPSRTVLVIGATGTQGGPVAHALLKSGYTVRAATRRPDDATELAARGAQPVRVDLHDAATVEAAADGARLAYFHAPMSLAGPQGSGAEREVIEALRRGGVEHIVCNTGFALPEQPVGNPMLDGRIEFVQALIAGGATVFSPTGYMENFSAPWSAPYVLSGELRYPLPPDAVNAWVTNEDIGDCTVATFERGEAVRGRWFRAAGPEALTLPEVAERLGRALDRTVEFHQITGQQYGQMIAPVLGEELGANIGAGYERMPPGPNPLLTPDTTPTREALGVTFTSVEEWARRQDWEQAAS